MTIYNCNYTLCVKLFLSPQVIRVSYLSYRLKTWAFDKRFLPIISSRSSDRRRSSKASNRDGRTPSGQPMAITDRQHQQLPRQLSAAATTTPESNSSSSGSGSHCPCEISIEPSPFTDHCPRRGVSRLGNLTADNCLRTRQVIRRNSIITGAKRSD